LIVSNEMNWVSLMESRCRYGKQEAVIITHRVQQAASAIEKLVKDFHVSPFDGILITQAINNDDQMFIAIHWYCLYDLQASHRLLRWHG